MATLTLTVLAFALASGVGATDPVFTELRVDPKEVVLAGPDATLQLLVEGKTASGIVDATHAATYESDKREVVSVSPAGMLQARGDGAATITVRSGALSVRVPVKISDTTKARNFHFENDITPILSRHSCNSSGCHGKSDGQNGFKLSVFGFDPSADHAALVSEARGRRITPAAPEHSVLLRKASGQVAHGGGVRIRPTSRDYRTLRDWIAAGAPLGDPKSPRVVSIRIEPRERIMSNKASQQLRVWARSFDGREFDVTAHARFQTNNEAIATVDGDGHIRTADTPGDGAIMASYLGHVDLCRVLVPRATGIKNYPRLPEVNFVDQLVNARLKKLNLLPSDGCDDATYLRRVYLDLTGTLPTPEESRRFLSDTRPDHRARLVDELLERPEYADFFALKWADLLRVDRQVLGHKNAFAYYKWIRDSFAANRPLDAFARELLLADGPLAQVPSGNFYRVLSKPGERASATAQVFLGVRIGCAECHHHPFDRWTQTDYQGMLAFFTQVGVRKGSRGEIVAVEGDPVTTHPRTGEKVFAHALGTTMPEKSPEGDRRETLAKWLTAPNNPWFARHMANRIWGHLLGRGLVEPIDDVRATNPPTNPELLDALADHLIKNKYDAKALIRTITASHSYQRATTPNETNERDAQNYSRALFKRVDAEVLLDMVCRTTGIGEKFEGVPEGTRALELWDSKANHYFLKIFGRPQRVTNCTCERNQEPSVSQVLHLLNSPEIQAKIQHSGGTVAKLVKDNADDGVLIEQLYLTFYSRKPTEKEATIAGDYLRKSSQRRQGAEDIAWALFNTLEFAFNH